MPRTAETLLVFECGVMRFDASANLFVHLTHSVDTPHSVVIDENNEFLAPATDRRAKVAGTVEEGPVVGSWPEFTASLPRGLVVEVRGYESLHLSETGVLSVVIGEHEEMPLWFEQGKKHLFSHADEKLRMWDKSSRPDIKKGSKAVAKKKEEPKKKTTAKKAAPKEAAAKKAAPKKAAPKKAAAKKAAPKKAAPKKAAPKKAAAKKAAPKKAAAKKAAPKKAAAKKAAPKKAAPKKAAPKKAAPKKATAKKAAPKKAAAKKAAPAEVAPAEVAPEPPTPSAAPAQSKDPASQWAGAQNSYASDSSRSYDTGSKGPLGCLSLLSAFVVGTGLLALLLL